MRSVRGTTQQLLKCYLAEQWYRSINNKKRYLVFKKILFLMKEHFYKKKEARSLKWQKLKKRFENSNDIILLNKYFGKIKNFKNNIKM